MTEETVHVLLVEDDEVDAEGVRRAFQKHRIANPIIHVNVNKCAAYNQNIAGYLVKSHVGDDFMHLMEMLGCYWRYVEFPPERIDDAK